MPNRPVHLTLRRWQVVGAFAILVASYVLGLVAVHHYAAKTNHTARHADVLAVSLSREIRARRRLAVAEFGRVQTIAQTSCRSRHKLYLTLRGIVGQGRRDALRELRGSLGRLPGARAALRRSAHEDALYLRALRGSDCHRVPTIVRKRSSSP